MSAVNTTVTVLGSLLFKLDEEEERLTALSAPREFFEGERIFFSIISSAKRKERETCGGINFCAKVCGLGCAGKRGAAKNQRVNC